jgi:hypothetical protein
MSFGIAVGKVDVVTSNHGGHSPEVFAKMTVDKLMEIADTAPEPIKAQALAFRDQIVWVVLEGIKSYRI